MSVVAHFEATAAGYGPPPEWKHAPDDLPDDQRMAHWDAQHAIKRAWDRHVLHGMSTGQLDPHRAKELGYYFDGHQTDRYGEPTWKKLPQHLYHVTTDLPGVRAHGLKTRDELAQMHGHGLGGGPEDMISLTSDHGTAQTILRALHEFHHVVNGRYTPAQMWEDARNGVKADRPFHRDIASYWQSGWKDGDPLPRGLHNTLHQVHRENIMGVSQEDVDQARGPGWHPAHDDEGWMSGHKPPRKVHAWWERDMNPDERRENAASFYKSFALYRAHAGGPEDPLFFSTDTKALAAKDPRHFGIVHVRPRPGAMGHQVSALGEWRTGTGDALEAHRSERLEGGQLKEAALVVLAARYEPGLPNPHTGGQEWFHGTQGHPDDFVHGFSYDDSHDHDDEELRGHLSHWNTLLGAHFAADHGVAEHFAQHGSSTSDDEDDWGGEHRSRYQERDPQSVIHARLHLANPKVYASEHDMDHEAYEHEYGRGNYIANHFRDEPYASEDPHHEDYDPETPSSDEEWPLAAKFRHDDVQPVSRDQVQTAGFFKSNGEGHPTRTVWLNSHPDKAGIARRFREHLEAQGHDGILYGNEFEQDHAGDYGRHSGLSAIIFHPRQAEVTQHHPAGSADLSPAEAELQRRRMPMAGQEELPGVEEHADRFPGGFLHGTAAVVAHFAGLGPGPHMQQKLFHMQPDPTLNAPGTRHNPADPLAGVRHRQEHEEGYVPPRETWDDPVKGNYDDDGHYQHPGHGGYYCHACSGYQGEPVFHDSTETSESHETAATDWDEEYPRIPATVHRGMRIEGGAHLADEADHEQVARAILRHVGDDHMHWTGNEEQARHYAGVGTGGRGEPADLNVVLHARKPEREDIETDPEVLGDRNVYGIGHHDDEEIPLRSGAPVHVTGVSWRAHDPAPLMYPHNSGWQRHDFGEHVEHTAALDPAIPSFTWRHQAYGRGPEGGYTDEEETVSGPFYHGGRSRRMQPGSMLRTGMPTNSWGDEGPRSQFIHFTTDLGGARTYAHEAGGHVYEIEPTGEVHMGYGGGEWKSRHPLRVIRRVPDEEEPMEPRTAALPDVVAHFEAEGPGNSLDAFSFQPVQPYVAAPEDYQQGREHLVARHGYTAEMHMPRNLAGLQNVHRGLHLPGPAGPADHQHDNPDDHHDPVFGAHQVVAHFGPPGHFEYYHGEGSEDGRPRTRELEEHLYSNGHGRSRWDTTVDEAIPRAQSAAYEGEGTNSQKYARYHERLEHLHRFEHEDAMARAHQHVEAGGDPGYMAEHRQELESGHHQQWQDEWEGRAQHQREVAEHLENGQVHMHGRDVPFHEMTSHLQTEHGVPSHGLPEHQLPESSHHDPYAQSLEEMHDEAHGDMGEYRHTDHGEYATMHGRALGSWDAEHHLANEHGFDIDELRQNEPSFDEMEQQHEHDHRENRRHLSHGPFDRMDADFHLPGHWNYREPYEMEEEDPAHHFDVHSTDEEGQHRTQTYHALDEDHARELHEDENPDHYITGVTPTPYRRPARIDTEADAPSEHGPDSDTASTWSHVPYTAPPRTREDLEAHVREVHGASHEGYGGTLSALHNSMHDSGRPNHQHDLPEGHDPVFGSRLPVVAHFALPGTPGDTVTETISALGSWEPQGPEDAADTARALPGLFASLRNGFTAVAAALEEMPVHPAVRDAVGDLAAQAARATQDAEDLVRGLPTEAAWGDRPNR